MLLLNPNSTIIQYREPVLQVHGKVFMHRDVNTLVKVGEPTPNPLALLAKG